MDHFLTQYIVSALWSSTDDDGAPLDDNYGAEDLAQETIHTMREDCTKFRFRSIGLYEEDNETETRAAHDFWLTRNGHGAGFWDGDWPEPYATRLTEIAKSFGTYELYIGDDGKIYGM